MNIYVALICGVIIGALIVYVFCKKQIDETKDLVEKLFAIFEHLDK